MGGFSQTSISNTKKMSIFFFFPSGVYSYLSVDTPSMTKLYRKKPGRCPSTQTNASLSTSYAQNLKDSGVDWLQKVSIVYHIYNIILCVLIIYCWHTCRHNIHTCKQIKMCNVCFMRKILYIYIYNRDLEIGIIIHT